jgi:hypothetical protein
LTIKQENTQIRLPGNPKQKLEKEEEAMCNGNI